MRSALYLPATALLALGLAGCQPPAEGSAAPTGEHYGSVPFEPCGLSIPMGTAVEARCTTVEVPENHAEPDGRRIELAVAWIPASGNPEPDPVVMIAGGPGQSALESYPIVQRAFEDVLRNRNVLLVDARGTGRSNPLACSEEEGGLAFDDPALMDPAGARAYAERCRDALSEDTDLRFYTTGDHIRDLEWLRREVGAPRLNLVGISYGTRVAQQYAATWPEHTRTVVLDSVVPNDLALGSEHARNLEDALEALFARCQAGPACAENLGDPAAHLRELTQRLQDGGLAPVRYRDGLDGRWHEEAPTFAHLAVLLRMYAYDPNAMATLPLLLRDASEGRYEAMLAQARMITAQMSEQIMYGMQMSVMCAEDYPELRARPEDADTVLGEAMVELTRAQCEVWPRGERAAGFREPLSTDVPLLAISGEFDPVTPPRYGDAVVSHLPNARHLVLQGQGHSVLTAGCMPTLFAQFVESADAGSLDTACLDRLRPVPLFAGTYGWEP